jgi:hypothetical protein
MSSGDLFCLITFGAVVLGLLCGAVGYCNGRLGEIDRTKKNHPKE